MNPGIDLAHGAMVRYLPRISIVSSSFNQGEFLEETIQSILRQRYPNLEYIIVDGGSTDNSVEIIQQYAPKLAYWVSEPDRGQSHAINKGLRYCTGDIITFCSSDDIYLPGTLEDVVLRWSENAEVGAIVGAFQYMNSQSELEGDARPALLAQVAPVDLTLGVSYRLHQVSTFYTREALDDVGRYVREDLHYTMDRELLYRVCRQYPITLSERTYGAFRRHESSKTVAEILAFAEEFAQLQYLFMTDDVNENRLRRKIARHQLARGQVKYAKSRAQFLDGIRALLKALWLQPSLALEVRYLVIWLEKLHLKRTVRALLRLGRDYNG